MENKLRYVGYDSFESQQEKDFFTEQNYNEIAREASNKIMGKRVVFSLNVVEHLLQQNFYNFKPPVNDIYSKFFVPPGSCLDKFIRAREETINMLVDYAYNEIDTESANRNLDISIIKHTDPLMQATPRIKLREKRPQTMLFNMNY